MVDHYLKLYPEKKENALKDENLACEWLSEMSQLVNKIFWLIKWPAALVSILLFPGAAKSFWALAIDCFNSPVLMRAFIGGVLLYMIVWFVIIKRTRASFLLTFEHELTPLRRLLDALPRLVAACANPQNPMVAELAIMNGLDERVFAEIQNILLEQD